MKNYYTYHENNFKVPDGYFDSIESSVLKKLNESEIVTKDSFIIPNNYFDSVEVNVFGKINTSSKTQKKIGFLKSISFSKIIPISIAASFALLVGLLFYNNSTPSFNSIAQNDIEFWLENNIQDVDSYLIADVYSNISINETYFLEDNDLLNYLENIDSESIIDEL